MVIIITCPRQKLKKILYSLQIQPFKEAQKNLNQKNLPPAPTENDEIIRLIKTALRSQTREIIDLKLAGPNAEENFKKFTLAKKSILNESR